MKAILFKDGTEVRRVSDYSKIDRRMRKKADLPAGYEWKLLVDGVRPTITSVENLVRAEVDNGTTNVDYPHLKQIDVEYSAVRKNDADIEELIEQAESNANESLIKNVDRLKTMVLYMAIVHRKLNGGNINAKMQIILDKGDDYALKLWRNDGNVESKKQELTNGQDPDIDTGWQV